MIEEQFTEAERALLRFGPGAVGVEEPALGFWRGGLYGLGIFAVFLLIQVMLGGTFYIAIPAVIPIFIASGLTRANLHRIRAIKRR